MKTEDHRKPFRIGLVNTLFPGKYRKTRDRMGETDTDANIRLQSISASKTLRSLCSHLRIARSYRVMHESRWLRNDANMIWTFPGLSFLTSLSSRFSLSFCFITRLIAVRSFLFFSTHSFFVLFFRTTFWLNLLSATFLIMCILFILLFFPHCSRILSFPRDLKNQCKAKKKRKDRKRGEER